MPDTPSKFIRTLLADDHHVVRLGLRAVLEAQGRFLIVGEASDGRMAVDQAISLGPDVVIMDLGMPALNGIDATKLIRAAAPDTRVIVLTMQNAEVLVRRAFEAGASAFLHKLTVPERLIEAIDVVLEGRSYVCLETLPAVLKPFVRGESGTSAPNELTSREREVLQLLAEGRTNKQIASDLQLTVKTVETHRMNLMRKIGAHSVADVVRYAIRNQIIEP